MTQFRQRFRAAHLYFVHEGGSPNTFDISNIFDPRRPEDCTRFERIIKNNVGPEEQKATITLKRDYVWPWADDPRFGWSKPSAPGESLADFMETVASGTWKLFSGGLVLYLLRSVEKQGFLRGHLFVEFQSSPPLQVETFTCEGPRKDTMLVTVNLGARSPTLGRCDCGAAVTTPPVRTDVLLNLGMDTIGYELGAVWIPCKQKEVDAWIHEVGHQRHLVHAASAQGANPILHDSESNDLLLQMPGKAVPANAADRGWDQQCVMSYAGIGYEYPEANKKYMCGKCLLHQRGWKVEKLGKPGPKVKEP
jgi:hypothetical protein